jgi:hypothetical protein
MNLEGVGNARPEPKLPKPIRQPTPVEPKLQGENRIMTQHKYLFAILLVASALLVFATACGATATQPAAPSQAAAPPATAAVPSAPTSSGLCTNLAQCLPAGDGRTLLLNNCASCHSAVCPVLGQKTADHWQAVKNNHRTRVSGLSDADYNTLFTYLAANLNDTKPEPPLSPELKALGTCGGGQN